MASLEGSTAIGRPRIEPIAANGTTSPHRVQRVHLPCKPLSLPDEHADAPFKPSAVGWEATVPLKELHSILARDRDNRHPVTTTTSSSPKPVAAGRSKAKTAPAKTRVGPGAGAKGAGGTQTAAPVTMTPMTTASSEIKWQDLVDAAPLSRMRTSGRASSHPHPSRHIQSHLVPSSSRLGALGTNLYMPSYKPGAGWTSPFAAYEAFLPRRPAASDASGVANNQGPSRSRDRDRRLSLIGPSESTRRPTSGNAARQEQQVEVEDEVNGTGGGRYPTRTRKSAAQAMDVDEEAPAEPAGQKKAASGGRKVAKGAKASTATKAVAAAKAGKQAASPSPASAAAATSGKRKRAQAPKISVQGPEDEHVVSEEEGGRATRASKRRKVVETALTTSPSAAQMPPPATIPSKTTDALAADGGGETSVQMQKTRSARGRAGGVEQTVEKVSSGPSTRSLRAAARGRSGASSSPPQETPTEGTAGLLDTRTAQDLLPAYSTRRSARTSDGSADSDDKDGKIGTSPSVQSDETAVERQAEQPKEIGFEGGQQVVSTLVDIVV